VIAARRTDSTPKPDYVDKVYPVSRLHQLLGESDFVLLSLPLTPASRHLVDEAALQAMKPSAVLINISRGQIVDEAALVRALRERRIARAALDVFAREPLQADNPLWELPNVIITPHISGPSEHYMDRLVEIFCRNLKRYLAGEALLNRYDSALGY
jgi:phosphoglycerate dehydrogenase-like enzyme